MIGFVFVVLVIHDSFTIFLEGNCVMDIPSSNPIGNLDWEIPDCEVIKKKRSISRKYRNFLFIPKSFYNLQI
jgi:hypothetical protein